MVGTGFLNIVYVSFIARRFSLKIMWKPCRSACFFSIINVGQMPIASLLQIIRSHCLPCPFLRSNHYFIWRHTAIIWTIDFVVKFIINNLTNNFIYFAKILYTCFTGGFYFAPPLSPSSNKAYYKDAKSVVCFIYLNLNHEKYGFQLKLCFLKL